MELAGSGIEREATGGEARRNAAGILTVGPI